MLFKKISDFLYKFFKKNGVQYILTNILFMFIFGFIYFWSYNFLVKNKELAKYHNLGELDDELEETNIFDAMSLSLITQSTVGYHDIINRKQKVSLGELNSNLMNFINQFHIFCVVLIIAYFI